MDNETIKILEEQMSKMPQKIIDFLHSSDWGNTLNNIRGSSRLSSEMSSKLEREVVLVLAGLIHPDDFHKEALEQVGGDEVIIDSIVAEIEEKIFAPIRAELVEFFEKQEAWEKEQEEIEKKEAEQVPNQTPAKTLEKMPDIAPDNLPVEEEGEISPIPNLIPKTRPGGGEPDEKQGEETHPFEEKMKKVFTGSPATTEDLSIETPAPEKNISIESDPYREPIV